MTVNDYLMPWQKDVIREVERSRKQVLGGGNSRGILLLGPSGSGKTHVFDAISAAYPTSVKGVQRITPCIRISMKARPDAQAMSRSFLAQMGRPVRQQSSVSEDTVQAAFREQEVRVALMEEVHNSLLSSEKRMSKQSGDYIKNLWNNAPNGTSVGWAGAATSDARHSMVIVVSAIEELRRAIDKDEELRSRFGTVVVAPKLALYPADLFRQFRLVLRSMVSRFELIDIIHPEDGGLPTMVSQALGTPLAMQGSDVMVSPPALRVTESDYKTFVTQVLASLRSANQADWDRCEPSFSYVDIGVQAGRRRRAKLPAASSGWTDHLVSASDKGLHRAAALYRCVRRHLWRTVVYPHHRCVASACQRLWWPITGCKTASFCPVAAAFVRWRLRWESAVRCTDLMTAAITPPLGLVTWLASAPIGPAAGTEPVHDWLVDHVLGCDLMDAFEDMLAEEIERPADEPIKWTREWAAPAGHSCWVCTGRGTKYQPATLFVRGRTSGDLQRWDSVDAGHYARHLDAIARIEH